MLRGGLAGASRAGPRRTLFFAAEMRAGATSSGHKRACTTVRAPDPLSDCVAALRRVLLHELRDRRAELTHLLLAAERLAPLSDGHARLLALTHSIAGRAGTFGLPLLSAAAADVHDRLEAQHVGLRDAADVLLAAVSHLLDLPAQAGAYARGGS
jgi:HPt (histidine-containing phosphotransfer) domain-containing protein